MKYNEKFDHHCENYSNGSFENYNNGMDYNDYLVEQALDDMEF